MEIPNFLTKSHTDQQEVVLGSDLHRMFELSTTMFETQDEESILRLAMSSVPALGAFQACAGYLLRAGELVALPPAEHDAPAALIEQLTALGGEDGPVLASEASWTWAFGLRHLGGLSGYLVLTGEEEPAPSELFLFNVLAQHTAAALTSASFLQIERDHALQLSRVSEDLAMMNQRLKTTVDDLQRRANIHDTFTRIAASDGDEDDVAAALHTLTDRPVAIEDRFGNLLSWAGPGEPHPYPEPNRRREETLQKASARNGVARDRERLVILAQPRHEILGVIALVDPAPAADPHLVYAMEHAGMALALRLTHTRNLAENELRLRRDLVEDLVAGEDHSVLARSEAVGHNLHGPHYALAVQWNDAGSDDAVAFAAQRAAKRVGMSSLVSRRSGTVILFNRGRPDREGFYHAMAGELGSECGAIGVGARCDTPVEFARSYREALRALRIRQASRQRCGTTFFDEIGLYRVLGQGEGGADIETFVRGWIGRLIDYDRSHHADLVNTLSHYLECGGNYNATASALVIHRSTLRYRLRRIREVSGFDLGNVDNRLNMHVATRAWRVLDTPS